MKYFIVWNEDKSEGVIMNDKADAQYTATGVRRGFDVTSLGDNFRELFDETDEFEIQEVDL